MKRNPAPLAMAIAVASATTAIALVGYASFLENPSLAAIFILAAPCWVGMAFYAVYPEVTP